MDYGLWHWLIPDNLVAQTVCRVVFGCVVLGVYAGCVKVWGCKVVIECRRRAGALWAEMAHRLEQRRWERFDRRYYEQHSPEGKARLDAWRLQHGIVMNKETGDIEKHNQNT